LFANKQPNTFSLKKKNREYLRESIREKLIFQEEDFVAGNIFDIKHSKPKRVTQEYQTPEENTNP